MNKEQLSKAAQAIRLGVKDICCKQDIPEVEGIILVILELLQDEWLNEMIRLNDDVLNYLERVAPFEPRAIAAEPLAEDFLRTRPDTLSSRTELGRQIIDYIIRMVERRGEAALVTASERAVEAAADTLLFEGALAAGVLLTTPAGSIDALMREAAVEYLRMSLAGHAALREKEIRTLVSYYLDDQNVRNPIVELGPRGGQRAPVLRGKPKGLRDFMAQLERAVGVETAAWLPQTVDLWAYRWFTIGAYRALRNAGEVAIYAQATIDSRTTPFCRWVDGRQINISRADRQVEQHVDASLAGDRERMLANWPLLTAKEVNGTPEVFAKAMPAIGLPPYHWRCRTVPVRRAVVAQ